MVPGDVDSTVVPKGDVLAFLMGCAEVVWEVEVGPSAPGFVGMVRFEEEVAVVVLVDI